jgi:hypothetical protein
MVQVIKQGKVTANDETLLLTGIAFQLPGRKVMGNAVVRFLSLPFKEKQVLLQQDN